MLGRPTATDATYCPLEIEPAGTIGFAPKTFIESPPC